MDRVFLDLLYYCGLRRGEALALTASDFDFKAFSLRVSKSLAFDGNKSILKDTKTHTARCVPIPPQIVGRLKSYIKEKPFALFTCENGSLMTPSAYRRMWERIQNQVNAAAQKKKKRTHKGRSSGGDKIFKVFIITPHMLRHDYATRLYYAEGLSLKKKAEILGHSEKLFTELYSHIDDQKEAFEIFQKSMNF